MKSQNEDEYRVLKKYKYLYLTEEDVKLRDSRLVLAMNTLENVALKAKPWYIPVFVANLMVKLNMVNVIDAWFNNNRVTSISTAFSHLQFTRAESRNQDFIALIMRDMIITSFRTCAICGNELGPKQAGITDKCVDCAGKY